VIAPHGAHCQETSLSTPLLPGKTAVTPVRVTAAGESFSTSTPT